MLLQKAFFRKKKIRIYFFIFVVLFSVLFLLNSYKNYYESFTNDFMVNHTFIVANTSKEHKDLVEKEREINAYQRAIVFEKGMDNNIITTKIINEKGEYVDESNKSKLDWKDLMYDKNQILVLPASFFDKKIEDNQIILYTKNLYTLTEYLPNIYNQNITFNFNNDNLELKITEVLDYKMIPCVCISDNLYNSLLPKEENYIYYVELARYNSLDKIQEKWDDLKKNNVINYTSGQVYKDDELGMDEQLMNIINTLKIVDIICLTIFCIIIVIVIKDLVSDEQKDILILKNIGYNKIQNIFNILKNILIFDVIVLMTSLLISAIIVMIINSILKFNLEILNYNFICYSFIGALLTELFFCIIYIKNY